MIGHHSTARIGVQGIKVEMLLKAFNHLLPLFSPLSLFLLLIHTSYPHLLSSSFILSLILILILTLIVYLSLQSISLSLFLLLIHTSYPHECAWDRGEGKVSTETLTRRPLTLR
jgi:Zn-dependent protease with chaperone function